MEATNRAGSSTTATPARGAEDAQEGTGHWPRGKVQGAGLERGEEEVIKMHFKVVREERRRAPL